MKIVAPDYYRSFACIAGQCRHSCCIGWEIDIDDDTLKRYQLVPGFWGERLRREISMVGDTAHFRLGEGERCPFLNRDGLCELILQFGEDSLCQICTDHPRFRHFFSDRTEIGLGLCCEEACRLALSWQKPVRLVTIEQEDEGDIPDAQDQAFFTWRDTVVRCAQNRDLPMDKRIEQISCMAQLDLSQVLAADWYPLLMDLERMDEAWTDALQKLHEPERLFDDQWEVPFEQLLVYLLLRHLPNGYEMDDLRGYLAFVILIWKLLRRMFTGGSMQELIELVRMYSSEIEYSDENIEKIIDELYNTVL